MTPLAVLGPRAWQKPREVGLSKKKLILQNKKWQMIRRLVWKGRWYVCWSYVQKNKWYTLVFQKKKAINWSCTKINDDMVLLNKWWAGILRKQLISYYCGRTDRLRVPCTRSTTNRVYPAPVPAVHIFSFGICRPLSLKLSGVWPG